MACLKMAMCYALPLPRLTWCAVCHFYKIKGNRFATLPNFLLITAPVRQSGRFMEILSQESLEKMLEKRKYGWLSKF
jgi:hypothetical protein